MSLLKKRKYYVWSCVLIVPLEIMSSNWNVNPAGARPVETCCRNQVALMVGLSVHNFPAFHKCFYVCTGCWDETGYCLSSQLFCHESSQPVDFKLNQAVLKNWNPPDLFRNPAWLSWLSQTNSDWHWLRFHLDTFVIQLSMFPNAQAPINLCRGSQVYEGWAGRSTPRQLPRASAWSRWQRPAWTDILPSLPTCTPVHTNTPIHESTPGRRETGFGKPPIFRWMQIGHSTTHSQPYPVLCSILLLW